MTEEQKSIDKGPWFGMRHVIVIHLFFLIGIGIGMRVHLSVAIVAMTESTSPNPGVPVYDWTNKSVVLSSFFWGYIILQVLAGEIGRRYGTKKILLTAMSINSSACLTIPFVANSMGSYGVMASRVIQGLAQGFFFPSSFNLLGKWAPVEERTTLGSVTLIGGTFGAVIIMPLVGYICSTWLGWPLSFYIHGAIGHVWAISWSVFGADSPALHPYISEKERLYIESSLGDKEENTEEKEKETEEPSKKVPWKAIVTSLPFWAIVVSHIGHNYGGVTLLTQMPTYMNKIIKFDIKQNGVLSATPYLVCLFLGILCGYVADYLINKNYFSRQNTRKLFNTIAFVVPAAALLILGFIPDDAKTLSVMMLTVAVGINAATTSGYNVNHIDLSPRFAGLLMGIGNSTGNIFAIIAPLMVQVIVTDETDKSLWRIVFVISAGFYLAAALFYLIFSSSQVQWWNDGIKPIKEVKEEPHEVFRQIAED